MSRKVKTSRGFLTEMFLTLLITASILVPALTPSSAQVKFCVGNLVTNGDFSAGINVVPGSAGSMPPSTVSNWSQAFGTPQLSALPGCDGTPGFLSMWGNKVVGEGVRQTLGTPLLAGRKYRISACVSWLNNNPTLPQYVRFNVRASSGPLANYTSNSNEVQIGVIGDPSNTPSIPAPGITSTQWTNITLADWTAPATFASYDTITINPENNSTVNNGAQVSWGRLDNLCIREVPAPPDFKSSVACEGQPTSFSGGAAGSWNWNFGDGSPNGTQQNLTHTYAGAGTYNVTLCVNGTTNCVTKPVTVKAAPPAPVIVGPASSCGAQTAAYSVQATPGVSYSWSVGNGVINGPSTGNTISVTWSPNGVGTISVTATNKAGCSTTVRTEVTGCELYLGECCLGFQAKADLQSLVYAGNGVYNFAPTLSVSQPNIIRVTANVISSSLTYSAPGCGTAGPVNSYVTGASNAGSYVASIPVTNGHEVIWHGPPANVGGLSFPMQIKFPPPPTGTCRDYLTFCVKYTVTDRNCRTCEFIRCYGPFKRGGLIKISDDFKEIKLDDFKVTGRP